MGVAYVIAGRKIASQYVVVLVAFLTIRRSKAKRPDLFTSSPPINVSSVEEELFIKEFMKSEEAEENKKAHNKRVFP
ncbi:15395_t:CDS:2 [Entrophospora sp. SA101]|nr:13059_t:CDS:2 [Entrophospora sp. SA101]CAJ0639987.1 15395_t:CDS:2 [Entrophospora sp. SA101]CAJ0835879.1 3667_t:CDS:2 [Entrophospora sp. SA101]CAJ0849791.1 1760_t:CDS:2 [Entrophospora sp. SA101]CAJ0870541.1 13168_t:CDS:2 [Entrophospora sp. SA101]